MDISAETLLDRAVTGDEDALMRLLEEYKHVVRGQLQGKIKRRWRSMLTIDDVVQQMATDAFIGIRRFVPHGIPAFVAWLCRLAMNNLSTALKWLEAEKRGGKWNRIEPAGAQDSHVALYERLGGTSKSPSRQAVLKEAQDALNRAIPRLPELYQKVVRMYDLEERSSREVAAALERSPGAIFMLRERAHGRLAEIMGTASRYLPSR